MDDQKAYGTVVDLDANPDLVALVTPFQGGERLAAGTKLMARVGGGPGGGGDVMQGACGFWVLSSGS